MRTAGNNYSYNDKYIPNSERPLGCSRGVKVRNVSGLHLRQAFNELPTAHPQEGPERGRLSRDRFGSAFHNLIADSRKTFERVLYSIGFNQIEERKPGGSAEIGFGSMT